MYTPDEILKVQAGMDEMYELDRATHERIAVLRDMLESGERVSPFLPLLADHPELYARIKADQRVTQFGPTAFLPATTSLVLDNPQDPTIIPLRGTRGPVFRFTHPSGSDLVIKPFQSRAERTIAPRVSALGIGPRQFPSIRNLMTEEFVKGTPTTQLSGTQPEQMLSLGRRLGDIFTTLHNSEGIFYNDAINDDFGKSHVIVPDVGDARLIDFGVALNMRDPSQFTDEDVWNYLRTLPEVNAFWDGGQEYAQAMVAQYGESVRATPSEEIVQRQLLLIRESLGVLAARIGEAPVRGIWTGFQEAYSNPTL